MTNTKEICTPVHMQESYANYTTDPSYFTKRSEVLYYLIDKGNVLFIFLTTEQSGQKVALAQVGLSRLGLDSKST